MSNGRGTMQPAAVQVQVRGAVPEGAVDYVTAKVDRVMEIANQPVISARAVLTMAGDPAMTRPARAEASLDVRGHQVRAQAAASDMTAAVDLLEERLKENLIQLQDRRRTRHRWTGEATEEGWRHGTLPTAREAYFPRPAEDREIVRRKTFALAPMSPDDAAYEMGVLGHDFYLFTDSSTGRQAVVYSDGDETFALLESAPTLSEVEAVTRLEVSGEPFVFYLDAEDGKGRVLYFRYDGHYGLITAA